MLEDAYLLPALIVGCEIGFWIVLLLALSLRYLLRKPRASRVLLLGLPLVDLLLLLFTAMDLRRGAEATFAHGLAAAYVGFTVAFGGLAVRWADAHFAFRFAGGPVPAKAPSAGWPALRYELGLWGRSVLACIITVVLIEVLVHVAETRDVAGAGSGLQALLDWHRHAFGCIVLWFLFGPVWTLATAWRADRR